MPRYGLLTNGSSVHETAAAVQQALREEDIPCAVGVNAQDPIFDVLVQTEADIAAVRSVLKEKCASVLLVQEIMV